MPDETLPPCPGCKGRGKFTPYDGGSTFSDMPDEKECPDCHGAGRVTPPVSPPGCACGAPDLRESRGGRTVTHSTLGCYEMPPFDTAAPVSPPPGGRRPKTLGQIADEAAERAAVEEVKRLRSILHDAEATPLSEVAQEMAALRENVAGTAALLKESEAEVAALRARVSPPPGDRRAETIATANRILDEVCGPRLDAPATPPGASICANGHTALDPRCLACLWVRVDDRTAEVAALRARAEALEGDVRAAAGDRPIAAPVSPPPGDATCDMPDSFVEFYEAASGRMVRLSASARAPDGWVEVRRFSSEVPGLAALRARAEAAEERVHKAEGMANEINILISEVQQVTARAEKAESERDEARAHLLQKQKTLIEVMTERDEARAANLEHLRSPWVQRALAAEARLDACRAALVSAESVMTYAGMPDNESSVLAVVRRAIHENKPKE